MTVKQFSLREDFRSALELAEYVTDWDGVVIARVPNTNGFKRKVPALKRSEPNSKM